MRVLARTPLRLVAIVLVLPLVFSGCAGVFALLQFWGTISSIASWLDDDDGDPAWAFGGYVFLNNSTGEISVRDGSTPPSGVGWVVYASAPLSVDALPPQATTTNTQGYFEFHNLHQQQFHLFVVAPDTTSVSFDVDLDADTIEPSSS